MNQRQIATAGPLGPNAELERLVAITRQPGGVNKLAPTERKLLLAAILASMVPVDHRITEIEVDNLKAILGSMLHATEAFIKVSTRFVDSGLSFEDLTQASRQIPELLGPQDRISMIKALWELALSDGELHPNEEALIRSVAATAQIPGKSIAEARIHARPWASKKRM